MGTPQSAKEVPEGDGINDVLALLNTVAGTESKTTGTANIGPLQQVMSQIAASQGTQGQQLLESIFSQAAGAVPGIMGNTFNASGSRAPNNVMAGTLQKLMADVTKQAQAQLVQQQQNAQQMQLQAASQIANATRGQRQVQKSGASDVIRKGGQILTANKVIKGLTGKDLIQSGVDAAKSLFSPAASVGGTAAGFGLNNLSPQLPLFGGTSTSTFNLPSLLSDFVSPVFGDFASPMSLSAAAPPLTTATPAVDQSIYTATGGVESGGSDLPAYLSTMSTSPSAGAGVFAPGAAPLSLETTDFSGMSNPLSTQLGSGVDYSKYDISAQPTDTGSAANDIATALKVYSYARDPNARKDIFDFSDGNFVDDVGDITDAASIYFPPLAAVRPAMNATVAAGESLDNFVHNPGQWFEDLFSGDEPLTENAWNTAVGTVNGVIDTVSSLGQDIADIGNEVGDFFGDVFGW